MASTSQTSSLDSRTSFVDPPAPESEFFPDSGNLFPKYADVFPRTAVEVWLFDALSPDGSDSFTVSFLRDAMAAPAGFRVAVNASWADGTNWSHNLVLPLSTVTQEASGRTVGIWRTAEDAEKEASATFEISGDLSLSTVTFNAPGFITGTLTHKNKCYPSLPATTADAKVGHDLYWMRPVAMASASLDIDITLMPSAEQKHMLIAGEKGGYGGLERSWEGMPWTKAITDSLFVRAQAGPYVLQVMRLVGRAENDYALTASARLYCDGKLVCSPQRALVKADGNTAGDGTYAVIVEKLYDGEGLPAAFRHKNVGYKIEFLADAKWVFELRHVRKWWVMPSSAPGPDATGSSAFVYPTLSNCIMAANGEGAAAQHLQLKKIMGPNMAYLCTALEIGVLKAFIDWKVFDHIPDDGSISSASLAEKIGGEQELLDRTLPLLTAQGILQAAEADHVAHTERSRTYKSDELGAGFITHMHNCFVRSMAQFPAYLALHGFSSPKDANTTPFGMATGNPNGNVYDIVAADAKLSKDFDSFVARTSKVFPMHGVYDLSWMQKQADTTSKEGRPLAELDEGIKSIRFVAGNALEMLPPPVQGALVYQFRRILNDFPDNDVRRFWKAVREAAAPDTRVCVVEELLQEKRNAYAVAQDLYMMLVGGKRRSVQMHVALAAEAGFQLGRTFPDTHNDCSVLEFVVAQRGHG
ncbi:hypothetical protein PTNB73_08423 [Pyrenophora teres f. teres]|nr:hypothetical protein PTNB73_08423 [Pyrenophora teres f. teres]